jgi:hypothetical protein
MNAEQALKEVDRIEETGNLARIYVDGGDCGAWEPAIARASIKRDVKIREDVHFEIRECERMP